MNNPQDREKLREKMMSLMKRLWSVPNARELKELRDDFNRTVTPEVVIDLLDEIKRLTNEGRMGG